MRKNWLVRVYDNHNHIVASWEILNRTKHEAEHEAQNDVTNTADYADWTMTEISE